jgi:hypothetical protein
VAKALTHVSEVVGSVNSSRLIALPTAGAADADPADLGRVQLRQTAASNSHASWPLEPIASIA